MNTTSEVKVREHASTKLSVLKRLFIVVLMPIRGFFFCCMPFQACFVI